MRMDGCVCLKHSVEMWGGLSAGHFLDVTEKECFELIVHHYIIPNSNQKVLEVD